MQQTPVSGQPSTVNGPRKPAPLALKCYFVSPGASVWAKALPTARSATR